MRSEVAAMVWILFLLSSYQRTRNDCIGWFSIVKEIMKQTKENLKENLPIILNNPDVYHSFFRD